jgi:hypothetical protein
MQTTTKNIARLIAKSSLLVLLKGATAADGAVWLVSAGPAAYVYSYAYPSSVQYANLDLALRTLGNNVTIYLESGKVFDTAGGYARNYGARPAHSGNDGFYVKNGWTIKSSQASNRATLRLNKLNTSFLNSDPYTQNAILMNGPDGTHLTSFTLTDIILDCGPASAITPPAPNQAKPIMTAAFNISLSSGSALVSNVWVKGIKNTAPDSMDLENFPMYIKTIHGSPGADVRFLNCTFNGFLGGYNSAMQIAGPEVVGLIQGCDITMLGQKNNFGLNVGGNCEGPGGCGSAQSGVRTKLLTYMFNTVRDAERGINNDTAPNAYVRILNNTFVNVRIGALIHASDAGEFCGNVVYLRDSYPTSRAYPSTETHYWGIQILPQILTPTVFNPYGAANWYVANNMIFNGRIAAGDPVTNIGLGIGTVYGGAGGTRMHPTGCTVERNVTIDHPCNTSTALWSNIFPDNGAGGNSIGSDNLTINTTSGSVIMARGWAAGPTPGAPIPPGYSECTSLYNVLPHQ